jgi:hypothetical protein
VFGAANIAMSQGACSPGDGWIPAGLALFAALVFGADGMVWQAKRRLRDRIAAAGSEAAGPCS